MKSVRRDNLRRAGACFIAIVFAASLFGAEKFSDWPQFRGPLGMGASEDSALPVKWGPKENIAWKIDLPAPGVSAPVVAGQRIYLTCYSGFAPGKGGGNMDDLKLHLLSLNRANGETIWKKEIAPKLPESVKIRESHGFASSSPVVDGERVYVFFGKSGVFAFDLEGKQQLWQADVGSKLHEWGSAASPLLYENLLIVNASVESETLFALNKKDGKEAWKFPGVKESWNTPILVKTPEGKTELVFAIQGKVIGLDPKTGEQLWTCKTEITWYMVPSLVAHDGIVYCLGGRSGVGRLAVRAGGKGDVTATHRLWKSPNGASNVTSPVFHDGHLYWMHQDKGIAYCVEGKSGELVYEKPLERAGQVYASAVLGDGKIYYLARNGRTYVVAAKPQFELLATNDLGERSVFDASPSIAGGHVYIRSDKTLYCIGK